MNYIETIYRHLLRFIQPDVATILGTFDKLEAKLRKHVDRQTNAVLRNRHAISRIEADTAAREEDAVRAMRVASKIKKLTD